MISGSVNGVVETEANCINCGYNLKTLRLDGVCPECSASIRSTIHGALQFAAPEYLVRLQRGASLACYSIVVLFLIPVVAGHSICGVITWMRAIVLFSNLLWLQAASNLTSPCPEPWRRPLTAKHAQFVRDCVILEFGFHVAAAIPEAFEVRVLVGFGDGLAAIAGLVGFVGLFTALRRLATRIPAKVLGAATTVSIYAVAATSIPVRTFLFIRDVYPPPPSPTKTIPWIDVAIVQSLFSYGLAAFAAFVVLACYRWAFSAAIRKKNGSNP